MTRGLSSKVRVVLNLLPGFLLALTAARAQQNILEKKVTVDFQNVRFSDALQEIEKQARVHFIYSSNVVEPGRKITYSVVNTPLAEVFTRLGHEMNVEFKAQNLYVIVKKGAVIPSPPTLTLPAPAETIAKEDLTQPAQLRRTKAVGETKSIDLYAQIHRQYLRKLDSVNLKNASLKVSGKQQIADRTSKFYAAAGLYVNDFSGGLELQAGIRSLYGVFNTGFSEGRYLRMGFGAGTNIHIAGKFRVSPIYTFSMIKEVTDDGISSIYEDGYTVKVQQHQLKLMFEYPFAKNFYAKLGPTFNVMNLNFRQKPDLTAYYAGRSQSRSNAYAVQQNHPDDDFDLPSNLQHTTQTSREVRYDAIKSWIGFEAGIYYSLNFSKRR